MDGQLAEAPYLADVTADGSGHRRKVTFTSPGWRRIRIDIQPRFFGLDIGPDDLVLPSPPVGDRLLVIHDSFGEGTGATTPHKGYAALAGAMLGFGDIINLSQGGTGVIAANAGLGRPNYAGRVADWAQAQATHVLIGMSINDDGSSAAQVADGLNALLPLVAALPTAPQVWVLGPPVRGGGAPGESLAERKVRDAVYRPVAEAHGATYVSLVSPSSLWDTEQGPVWDVDGVHPSNAGHEGIARVFVSRLLAALA